MANIQIRLATEADAEAIAAIYGEHVIEGESALEVEPPTGHEMACKICECREFYPFLVCEIAGEVAGYAYACRHLEGEAFAWGASAATYVSKEMLGRGIGCALLDALEETLRLMGVVNLYSVVTHSTKSQYFHQARGFSEVGRLREAAYKAGQWRDIAYYEKSLALHEESPQAVRPVGEVDARRLEKVFEKAGRRIKG